MDTTKTIAALFDFDGVIMDTELQYTIFWNEQGEKYLHVKNFGPGIKGQTLTQIYDKHFAGELVSVREQITSVSICLKKIWHTNIFRVYRISL